MTGMEEDIKGNFISAVLEYTSGSSTENRNSRENKLGFRGFIFEF